MEGGNPASARDDQRASMRAAVRERAREEKVLTLYGLPRSMFQ